MEDLKNSSDLLNFIEKCRKKGVSKIEIPGIKIELREEAPPSNYKKKLTDSAELKAEDVYSEEDTLFWSSTGIPEVASGS